MYKLLIDSTATVLVTGATGFVGRALLHTLSTRGCQIKILARSGSDAQLLANNYGAELITGDILSTTAVREACFATTHVFHLASRGQNNVASGNNAQTRRVNVGGTKVLARCIADLEVPPRIIHCSTVSVHGHVEDGPGNEQSIFNAKTAYELTKLEAELWLRNFTDRTGIPLVVLRPCAIVGPGDQRLLKLFRLANRRWVPIVGSGNHRYQIIHVNDCARSLIAAGEHTAAPGSTYICGNPSALTLREMLRIIGSKKSRRVNLPPKLVAFAVAVLEKGYKAINLTPPITTERLAFFSASHWFDTSKFSEEIGVEFIHTDRSALSATRRWYSEQGLLK